MDSGVRNVATPPLRHQPGSSARPGASRSWSAVAELAYRGEDERVGRPGPNQRLGGWQLSERPGHNEVTDCLGLPRITPDGDPSPFHE